MELYVTVVKSGYVKGVGRLLKYYDTDGNLVTFNKDARKMLHCIIETPECGRNKEPRYSLVFISGDKDGVTQILVSKVLILFNVKVRMNREKK